MRYGSVNISDHWVGVNIFKIFEARNSSCSNWFRILSLSEVLSFSRLARLSLRSSSSKVFYSIWTALFRWYPFIVLNNEFFRILLFVVYFDRCERLLKSWEYPTVFYWLLLMNPKVNVDFGLLRYRDGVCDLKVVMLCYFLLWFEGRKNKHRHIE